MPVVSQGYLNFERKLRGEKPLSHLLFSGEEAHITFGNIRELARLADYVSLEEHLDLGLIDNVSWSSDPIFSGIWSDGYDAVASMLDEGEDDYYESADYCALTERIKQIFVRLAGGADMFGGMSNEVREVVDMRYWDNLYQTLYSTSSDTPSIHRPSARRGSVARPMYDLSELVGTVST